MATDTAPGTGAPRRRRHGPLPWALALAFLVLIAAAACTRWPVPVGLVERLLAQRLERSVDIEGEASFCLCPRPSVRVDSIAIGPPEWSERDRFARVTDAEVVVSLPTLFGARPRIHSLRIGSGEVVLERKEDGRASWQFAKPDDQGGAAQPEPPVIERLEARDVAWTLVDPARRIDLSGTLSLTDGEGAPGRGAEPPRLRVEARGTMRGMATEASVEGGGVLPGGAKGPRPLKASARVGDGRLEFDGTTTSLASLDGLDGGFHVSGPALAALGGLVGAVLPRTPPFKIDGRIRRAESRWELAIQQATVGGSDLRGDLVYAPAEDRGPTRLEGTLRSKTMRIADLGRSVGFGEREPDTKKRPGRVLPDVSLDLPALRNMDASVDLRIDTLELGSLAPVTGLAARLRLREGVLAVGELAAQVAGGRISGEVRIDGSQAPGRVGAKLAIREVALQRWLPKLRGEPPITSRLNLELTLDGRGDSVADVLGRADGRARIALGPGDASRLVLELAGLDIAESLAALSGGEKRVRLDCGIADIPIRKGVAEPELFVLDTRDTVLTAEGNVNLAKETLAMRMKAAPRDFSPFTLRSPIVIGGTFADPEVGLDKTRVAGTVIAAAVLGAVVAPVAALLPLLDFGEGDAPSPCRERLGSSAGSAKPAAKAAPAGKEPRK